MVFEPVEAIGPKAFVEAKPGVGRRERSGLQTAKVRASEDPSLDEARGLEHFDVLRSSRERHLERRAELADGQFAGGESAQHGASRRIGQGVKHAIERRCHIFNHMV